MAAILDDSTSGGLFGVESILPAQFWESARRPDRGMGERRLMLAVLQDALLTLVKDTRPETNRSRRLVEEVRRWFASDSRAHPFAFAVICDVLGLEVAYVRAAVRRLHAKSLGGNYRRDYAGRGRHQVERPVPSRMKIRTGD